MEICLWWLNLWTSGRKRSSRWKSSAPVPSGSFWEKEELFSERHSQDETPGSSSKKSLHDTPDPSPPQRVRHDTPDPSPPRRARHDTPDPSPPRRARHDTPDPSPPRRARHDTPDPSPRRTRHDTPDPSPPRRTRTNTPDPSPPRRARHDTPDPSPPRRARHDTPDSSPRRKPHHPSGVSPRRTRRSTPDLSPPRKTRPSPPETSLSGRTRGYSNTAQHRRAHPDSRDLDTSAPHSLTKAKSTRAPERTSSKHDSNADLSPPRKKQAKTHYTARKPSPGRRNSDSDLSPPRNRPRPQSSDSDLSPPRRKQRASSDSDLSPPRRKRRANSSDSDLSPPRRSQPRGKKAAHMYSGAKTGLVLTDIQQEQQELRKRDQETVALEAEFQHAETVFRDKSGRKRNLKMERLEQRKKAEKDSERDELYAQWGKGLVQSRQQQQNVEDAMKEMQKPLARYIDDEDLDRMLREQEREGDPMANFIKKNKAKENKSKKARPRYNGPAPPPNRFNIWPGYRWDGVDRSNGFEQKRFARLASKKAIEEMAYKWSVEDM
ncbi:BUD13 homolog isoform X2 [Sorex fumeus]|uniref:BUD13 homolog isoform X2 n=1 Tax=Sorex fumeus TaxID=62283 RepID=UPI0024AE0941|nr:BUD13 homolog isoform X2 [Sorex fumeus]